MTFCTAIKVDDGIIGLADTRLTSGSVQTTARKLTILQHGNHAIFIMTSGLRSLRDKAITYFNEMLEEKDESFEKIYHVVNALGQQIRRVAEEDKKSINESGLDFNLHVLIGGQLERDDEHKLYHLYPEGNWIEVGVASPYYIIGETAYGMPLMDRAIKRESSIEHALKIAYLAFDATRTSATTVDFPIDICLYRKDSYQIIEKRFYRKDLIYISEWWQQKINTAINEFPQNWCDELIELMPKASIQSAKSA